MENARPLKEFDQLDWILVDFGHLVNYRRNEKHRRVVKRIEDIFDQEMSEESIQKMFEEEDDEGWIDEVKEEHNHDEPKNSFSTTSCTPIEDEDFESLEELDWSLPFNHKQEFIAKEIKRRASVLKDKLEKIGLELENTWEEGDTERTHSTNL